MGSCTCNTQCTSNSNCDDHLGCPSYSDPVTSVSLPDRPVTGDDIDASLLNGLIGAVYDSVHSTYSATELPDTILTPYREDTDTKRRVNSSDVALDGQPTVFDVDSTTSNELSTGDSILSERDSGGNYPLDYNGLIEYLSNTFKYTVDGTTVTYLSDTDEVTTDDTITLALVQRLWDGVESTIMDCVCNYDRCTCNSVCSCNVQCRCNTDY